MKELNFIYEGESIRLDLFLSKKIEDMSRTAIQKLIKDNFVFVNGENTKSKYILCNKDDVTVKVPDREEIKLVAEKINLDIAYEDEYIIIVNKPKDMVVHPAPGSENNTLVNGLLNYTDKLSDINPLRPGIVHRLDKDTTGLIICAKDNTTHLKLVDMFSKHEINKIYLAICHGSFSKNHDIINKPIGRSQSDRKKMEVTLKNSKEAITEYDVIENNGKYSILKVKLHTGRTHQIRVHLANLKHPILGDKTYGYKNEKVKLESQMLHAFNLRFIHPIKNIELDVYANPPEDFITTLNKVGLKEIDFKNII